MFPPVPPAAAPLGDVPLDAFDEELFTAPLFPPLPASDPPAPPFACPDKLPACPADPADPPPTTKGVCTPPALPAGEPAPPPPPPPEDPFVVAPLFLPPPVLRVLPPQPPPTPYPD